MMIFLKILISYVKKYFRMIQNFTILKREQFLSMPKFLYHYQSYSLIAQILKSIIESAQRQILLQQKFHSKNQQSIHYADFIFRQITNIKNTEQKADQNSLKLNIQLIEQQPQPEKKVNEFFQPIVNFKAISKKQKNKQTSSYKSLKIKIKSVQSKRQSTQSDNNSEQISEKKQEFTKRKKYFSQYNNSRQKNNRFHKLNPGDHIAQNKNKRDISYDVQAYQDKMRQYKITQQLNLKLKNRRQHIYRLKKCASEPVQTFPLLQNVNSIKYSIQQQKKIKNVKKCFNPINVKKQKSKKFFNPQKSKLKIQRQKQQRNFFEKYHQKYDPNQMKQQEKMIKNDSMIKLVDQFNYSKERKNKKKFDAVKQQARRKSLTILGGRQRRTSKVGPQNILKMEPKLPQIKNNLKLQSRFNEKQNQQKSQKVVINNRQSFKFLLKEQGLRDTKNSNDFNRKRPNLQLKNEKRINQKSNFNNRISLNYIKNKNGKELVHPTNIFGQNQVVSSQKIIKLQRQKEEQLNDSCKQCSFLINQATRTQRPTQYKQQTFQQQIDSLQLHSMIYHRSYQFSEQSNINFLQEDEYHN